MYKDILVCRSTKVIQIGATHLLLPGLKQVTVMKEEWLHLVDTPWGNEDEIENGKQTELKIERAIAHHPESKPAKQRCKYVENYLIPHVVLITQVRNQSSIFDTMEPTGDRHIWTISR